MISADLEYIYTCVWYLRENSLHFNDREALLFREHIFTLDHEFRRKAGGNLHLRSAVVDLRVQLVARFYDSFLYVSLFSLARS